MKSSCDNLFTNKMLNSIMNNQLVRPWAAQVNKSDYIPMANTITCQEKKKKIFFLKSII